MIGIHTALTVTIPDVLRTHARHVLPPLLRLALCFRPSLIRPGGRVRQVHYNCEEELEDDGPARPCRVYLSTNLSHTTPPSVQTWHLDVSRAAVATVSRPPRGLSSTVPRVCAAASRTWDDGAAGMIARFYGGGCGCNCRKVSLRGEQVSDVRALTWRAAK